MRPLRHRGRGVLGSASRRRRERSRHGGTGVHQGGGGRGVAGIEEEEAEARGRGGRGRRALRHRDAKTRAYTIVGATNSDSASYESSDKSIDNRSRYERLL